MSKKGIINLLLLFLCFLLCNVFPAYMWPVLGVFYVIFIFRG